MSQGLGHQMLAMEHSMRSMEIRDVGENVIGFLEINGVVKECVFSFLELSQLIYKHFASAH